MKSISEQLTYSTVLIRCTYANGTSGSGTGFIISLCHHKEKNLCVPVLITNNHVVENSTKTIFEFCKADENQQPVDTETVSFVCPSNLWIPHPDPHVDLRCLPIAPIIQWSKEQNKEIFYVPLDISLLPAAEALEKLDALEEVVMIGYPIGLSDMYNHKPVIRRGITATHPRNNYQGKKEILLDIAAFPGSSGSPVFILNQGPYSEQGAVCMGTRLFLLGILYAGPQYNAKGDLKFSTLPNMPFTLTSIPTNLGIIIKSERIREFEKLFQKDFDEYEK